MSPLDVLNVVVSRLNKIGIQYMVGGSFASSAHGIPRSTQDADVVVDLKPEQIGEFVETFRHDFYVDAGQVKEAVWRNDRSTLFTYKLFSRLTYSFSVAEVLTESNFPGASFSRSAAERTVTSI